VDQHEKLSGEADFGGWLLYMGGADNPESRGLTGGVFIVKGGRLFKKKFLREGWEGRSVGEGAGAARTGRLGNRRKVGL